VGGSQPTSAPVTSHEAAITSSLHTVCAPGKPGKQGSIFDKQRDYMTVNETPVTTTLSLCLCELESVKACEQMYVKLYCRLAGFKHCKLHVGWAVPYLRRLAASIPLRRPGFDPRSVHVGFVVDKLALGQVFPPSSSVFPCQFHSTAAPLLGKGQKITIIFIFVIGLHSKPAVHP
jgi:hypothetical protein